MTARTAMVASRGGGVVTLSGESVVDVGVFPGTASAFIDVLTDGTLESDTGGIKAQIDAGTDWIIPNSAASVNYKVRFTNLVGDALTTPPDVEDAWVAVTETRSYGVFVNTDDREAATFDLEIRFGSGPTLASTNFSVDADNNTV